MPPINIVLPSNLQYLLQDGTEKPHGHLSDAGIVKAADIDGFLDDALRAYAAWQQSRYRDPAWKAEIGKALDIL